MSPKVGRNPDGSYLMELGTPNPCSMGVVRNDVQHASYFNRGYEAIEILCGRINDLDALVPTPPPPAHISFAWAELAAVTVGPIGCRMAMAFGGTLTKAWLEVTPSGSLSVRLLKNGINASGAAPLTVVAGTEAINTTLVGWTVGFVEGDTFQVEVLSATTVTAFTVTLKATRL